MTSLASHLQTDGFCILESCLNSSECREWMALVSESIEKADTAGRLQTTTADQKVTYGSRNLLSICPQVVQLLNLQTIAFHCREILGAQYGVVRGLYFDKPPGVSWSLPWHQDLTIAVANHAGAVHYSTDGFSKPTIKAGINHVEAPRSLLESMLTVRIHLDAMNQNNGPVLVRKGSHLLGKLSQCEAVSENEAFEVHCPAGSAMLMRPLLSHASIASKPHTNLHRRTIHLELSATKRLPDGFLWQKYFPVE